MLCLSLHFVVVFVVTSSREEGKLINCLWICCVVVCGFVSMLFLYVPPVDLYIIGITEVFRKNCTKYKSILASG